MKTWYVDDIAERADHRCLHCGHRLAYVDEVGWVAVGRGDSYDVCEADVYGNHVPAPQDPSAS